LFKTQIPVSPSYNWVARVVVTGDLNPLFQDYKTEYLGSDHSEEFQIDGNTIQTVKQFNYLGSLVQENKKAHDSVRKEVLHNILTESGVPMKLVVFFSLAEQPQIGPWPTSMKLSVLLQFSRS
jgi:hypothetical protein